MSGRPRIVGLVPMRHSSERVPGKNYRDFNGKPLYRWIVESLLGSGWIEEVLIDTDSEAIVEDATGLPQVRTAPRPEHLRADAVPMNDVLLHDVTLVDADWYLQTHSTNPLLRPETIARAIESLLAATEQHDSLFSVTALRTRLYWEDGRPVNHDPAVLLRTQDLPPVYEENSCIYLFRRETLVRRRSRIGARPLMFEIPAEEAIDIDVELDFRVAETIGRLREKSP
jgi:CMP-N-acetylneuraminic acid synthetase